MRGWVRNGNRSFSAPIEQSGSRRHQAQLLVEIHHHGVDECLTLTRRPGSGNGALQDVTHGNTLELLLIGRWAPMSALPAMIGPIPDSMAGMIGGEAVKPNPSLRPFEVLVGEWRTSGTHPLAPGTTYHGRTAFSWHQGGAFLMMRSEIDESGIPSGVAIFGSDDAAATFFMLYFDERGVSRKYDVMLSGNRLVWQRDEAGFAQRNTLVIDDNGSRMFGTGEMSRSGGEWEGDLSLTYERIS